MPLDSNPNLLLKCKLILKPWAWTLTCIKLDLEKKLFLRHIFKPIWMSSSKPRWTLNFSKVLMSNINPNSLETSSTLLSADSKIAETLSKLKLRLALKKLLNNQLSLIQILERKLLTSKTGHLVSETLSQLSTLKMESQHHPTEPSFNWTNQLSPIPTLEKKLLTSKTGPPESETLFQLSTPKTESQHHPPEPSSNSTSKRRKEWPPTPLNKLPLISKKRNPMNSSSHTPKLTPPKMKSQSEQMKMKNKSF